MGGRKSRRISRSIDRFLQSKARGLEVERGDLSEWGREGDRRKQGFL